MTTSSNRFGFNTEVRVSDIIQMLILVVAFTAWQIRTEGRIGEVASANKQNANNITAVAESLDRTAQLLQDLQRNQIDIRIWAAKHDAESK